MELVLLLACLLLLLSWWGLYRLTLRNGASLLRAERAEQELSKLGLRRLESLGAGRAFEVGNVLNDFELARLAGGTRTLSSWRGRRVALIFVQPDCLLSHQLVTRLAATSEVLSAANGVVLVSTGDPAVNRAWLAPHPLYTNALVQEAAELARLWGLRGTPIGFAIDARGAMAGPLVAGVDELEKLARWSAGVAEARDLPAANADALVTPFAVDPTGANAGLPLGAPAPAFDLPGLSAERLSLDNLRGQRLLLVFVDPECEPCRALLPRLAACTSQRAGLSVLLISRGDAAVNRAWLAASHVDLPIALQPGWTTSRAYRVLAAPAAYLIDGNGAIERGPAIGVEAILALSEGDDRVPKPANLGLVSEALSH